MATRFHQEASLNSKNSFPSRRPHWPSSMRRGSICCLSLLFMPLMTWAAKPFETPYQLMVFLSAEALVKAQIPFEIMAATPYGMLPLGQPSSPLYIPLVNLDAGDQLQLPDQGFDNLRPSGHYQFILVDASRPKKINYNFIISITDERCANMIIPSNGVKLEAQTGQWLEFAVLKVEEGSASIPIASPTTRICTNSEGNFKFGIPRIEGGKFRAELTALNEQDQPSGSYPLDIFIEHPSDAPDAAPRSAR
jgi:hypothetical protein